MLSEPFNDSSAAATKRFFAAEQNRLHYSVHGRTAAEVIYNRADAEKEHMGLTTWDGSPKSKTIGLRSPHFIAQVF